MSSPKVSNVLLLLFPNYNTLDVNGPYETLRSARNGARNTPPIFNITIAAEEDITVSAEGMRIQRDIPLNSTLLDSLLDYDTLIIPGAPTSDIQTMILNNTSLFHSIILSFSQILTTSPTSPNGLPRILMSICTGALFLANLGIFNGGRKCTTHHLAYDEFVKLNKQSAEKSGDVRGELVKARFVDIPVFTGDGEGNGDKGARIISAGGVSSGIDASLHLLQIRGNKMFGGGKGGEIAGYAAEVLEYASRVGEGVVV